MTLLVEAIFAFIAGASTSAGERVYPQQLPQQATLPAITYSLVSNPGEPTHSGPSKLRHPRFQFDCWGNTYLAAALLAEELQTLMDGYKGGMGGITCHASLLQDGRDNDDPETGRHWVSVDMVIWHSKSEV